jgi:hypothetical protein
MAPSPGGADQGFLRSHDLSSARMNTAGSTNVMMMRMISSAVIVFSLFARGRVPVADRIAAHDRMDFPERRAVVLDASQGATEAFEPGARVALPGR